MESLVVELNESGPQSIDVAAPSFTAEGPFQVVLDNHGAALHVYLQLDDDLARSLTLGAVNHYVEEGSTRRVRVEVDEPQPEITGRLKIVTGYGSETEFVSVTVREPDPEADRVQVDESLARPKPKPQASAEPAVDPQSLPIAALGALAIVVALLAAMAVGGGLPLVAILIVLVGAAVAVALLIR